MAQNHEAERPPEGPLTREEVAAMLQEALSPMNAFLTSWTAANNGNGNGQEPAPAGGALASGMGMALLEMAMPHVMPAIMAKVMGGAAAGAQGSLDTQLNGLASLMRTVNDSIVRPQADRDLNNIRYGIDYGVRVSTGAYRATGNFPDPDHFESGNKEVAPLPAFDQKPDPAAGNLSASFTATPWRSQVDAMAVPDLSKYQQAG